MTDLKHSPIENIFAFLIGTTIVSFGLAIFQSAGLLTGGTVGIAFLIHYATEAANGEYGVSLGWAFFLINLPFYLLAWRKKGWRFTVATFVAVGLVSILTSVHSRWAVLHLAHPLYAALVGGSMLGVGLLILFRHQASLGGVNIVALYAQERFKWRAGYVLLSVDIVIVLAALAIADLATVAYSVVGAITMNMAIAMNHRPNLYRAA